MQFPTVSGQDLLRRKVTLPSGLEGHLNLVLVAFQRWHQALVDSWLPAVDAALFNCSFKPMSASPATRRRTQAPSTPVRETGALGL